jgi:uncharacterized protein
MLKTLIVPGLDGSGPKHWQREWAMSDETAEIVEQEDWARPDLTGWLHTLEARIMEAPGAVLVAHSLGCALVAHLAGRPAAAHVAGALLVAPAQTLRLAEARPDLADFRLMELKRLPFPSILAASRNDPYLTWPEAEAHAAGWGSALVDLGQAGHVNTQSGYGPWADGPVLADGLRGRRPGRAGALRWWSAVPGVPGPAHDVGLGLN